MPIDHRFDDLDLRVEPPSPETARDTSRATFQNTCHTNSCPGPICSDVCCTA